MSRHIVTLTGHALPLARRQLTVEADTAAAAVMAALAHANEHWSDDFVVEDYTYEGEMGSLPAAT